MRIRTQLILAAFVLAVIPLAAIVTYSYTSSRRALESAYRREADRLNRQMDRRLASIRADLDQRLSIVSSLPLPSEANPDAGGSIVTVMGDAASLVDSLEFQPIHAAGMQSHVEPPDATPELLEPARTPEPAARPAVASMAPPPPEAPRPPGPLVIELPPMVDVPRFVMSEEQKELVEEQPRVSIRKVTKKDVEQGLATAKRTSLIFGREFEAPVRKEGEVVGQLTARISNEQVVRRVLGSATEDSTEVPFALDREGTIYTRNPAERALLERLGVPQRLRKGESLGDIEGWIVTSSTDSQSGLRIGVARPVGDHLDELRNTAARNFSLGLGLIAFALIGIVPLTNHLTRDVKVVTEGAERIAHGDLMTRLPVNSKNELGQLARAFNRMAEDLSHQQQRLLEQERARKEQELQQRLMSVEYERKSVELEDARRFQLSMLPKEVPRHERYDVAVYTSTATEVGGDYYDFHLAGDVLAVTIGDATGHGAKAGTMVTIVKTLFAGYDGLTGPAEFLHDAAGKIKRMELGRMAMALSLGRMEPRALTLSSAGMPPVLVHRAATSWVEEVALNATPLGTLGSAYDELKVALDPGDTVLFLSDGFPELMNDAGQQLGYGAALEAFADAARGVSASAVIAGLAAFASRWHGDAAPNDDVTFVVVRVA